MKQSFDQLIQKTNKQGICNQILKHIGIFKAFSLIRLRPDYMSGPNRVAFDEG